MIRYGLLLIIFAKSICMLFFLLLQKLYPWKWECFACISHNCLHWVDFGSWSPVWYLTGYLGAVPGLEGTQTSPTESVFKWSKPYSLVGVPVLGYQIRMDVVDSLSGDSISHEMFLNDTNYTLTTVSSADCTHVNITLFAINNVGPGKQAYYNFRFIESKPVHEIIAFLFTTQLYKGNTCGNVTVLFSCTIVDTCHNF